MAAIAGGMTRIIHYVRIPACCDPIRRRVLMTRVAIELFVIRRAVYKGIPPLCR